jgi:hypothetical protein
MNASGTAWKLDIKNANKNSLPSNSLHYFFETTASDQIRFGFSDRAPRNRQCCDQRPQFAIIFGANGDPFAKGVFL